MAHSFSNAPALADGAIAAPLPSRGDLRSAVAARMADTAVLLVRGSAAAILLSPALLVALLIAG